MHSLREALQWAGSKKQAIGHFNVSEFVALSAVATVARELRLPVIVGVSEGERRFLGVRQVRALVESYREEFGQDIFLNADHSRSLASVEEAARAGFDPLQSSMPPTGPLKKTPKPRELPLRRPRASILKFLWKAKSATSAPVPKSMQMPLRSR